MEDTNGKVRRRGSERLLVAATLAAVAMLGCSGDDGGNRNPTAPSAVNAPTTASSVSAVATPTRAGARGCLVRESAHGGRHGHGGRRHGRREVGTATAVTVTPRSRTWCHLARIIRGGLDSDTSGVWKVAGVGLRWT